MNNFRVLVKTSKGNFIYPADYVGVVLEGNNLKYELIGNIREGDSIFVRKKSSEKITLQGHIIPTLWAGSELYRKDRGIIFEPSEESIPTKTKLSTLLQKIVVTLGKQDDPVHTILNAIPEDIKYSYDAVSNWISGKVMLPNEPRVLESIGTKFNSQELLEWHSKLRDNDYAPVRRIRVLHSGLKALLSLEESRSTDDSVEANKHNYSTGEEKLVSLADAMRILKNTYESKGEELFEEFVTVTRVKSIIELASIGKKTAQRIKSGESVLERGILSFKMSNEEQMNDITRRYSGEMPKVRIEAVAKEREALIREGVEHALRNIIQGSFNALEVENKNKFAIFEVKNSLDQIKNAAGNNLDLEKLKIIGVQILLKNTAVSFLRWLLLSEQLNDKIQRDNLFLSLFESQERRSNARKSHGAETLDEFFRYLSVSSKEFRDLQDIYLGSYSKAYGSSKILKQLFNDEKAFLEGCSVLNMYKNNLSMIFGNLSNLDSDWMFKSHEGIRIWEDYTKFIRGLRAHYQRDDNLIRIRRDIKKLEMPSELALIQDNHIFSQELIDKLLKMYGTPIIPTYFDGIDSLIKTAVINFPKEISSNSPITSNSFFTYNNLNSNVKIKKDNQQ